MELDNIRPPKSGSSELKKKSLAIKPTKKPKTPLRAYGFQRIKSTPVKNFRRPDKPKLQKKCEETTQIVSFVEYF